jgi:hypothetical protein
LEVEELEAALARARETSADLALKERAKALHAALDEVAARQGYYLKLRK